MKPHSQLTIYECSKCLLKKCVGFRCTTKHMINSNPHIDGRYISARNALIPEAEKFADERVARTRTDAEKWLWNRLYHGKMKELAAKL